jgi:hypothetical protein
MTCTNAGLHFRSLTEDINTTTPGGKLVFHMFAALEHAQQIAARESPRTTKLYDRTQDEISLHEVERIQI